MSGLEQLTAERIVTRPIASMPAFDIYATDAALRGWTKNRAQAHRFADWSSAMAAINAVGRTSPILDPDWIDPYITASYRIDHPTVDDAALAWARGWIGAP